MAIGLAAKSTEQPSDQKQLQNAVQHANAAFIRPSNDDSAILIDKRNCVRCIAYEANG